MGTSHGHPLFAAFWDHATRHEGAVVSAQRDAVAGGARGDVLEIGIGTGSNWSHLPAEINYIGIEPDSAMLDRAHHHAATAGNPHTLLRAAGEALPFQGNSFDTVISTLTLCSVRELDETLTEVSRVLRPGGEFRFWEHVRPLNGAGAFFSDLVSPAWQRAGGGCHPNRRILQAIESAFHVEDLQEFRMLLPMIRGHARARGAEAASS